MLQTQVSISADLRIEHFPYLDPDFLPPFRNNVQCPVQSGDLHGALHGAGTPRGGQAFIFAWKDQKNLTKP